MFHQSVVTSVLSFDVACWGSTTSEADLPKLDKLIRWAGGHLDSLATVAQRSLLHWTMADTLHTFISSQRGLFRSSKVQDHQMEELMQSNHPAAHWEEVWVCVLQGCVNVAL